MKKLDKMNRLYNQGSVLTIIIYLGLLSFSSAQYFLLLSSSAVPITKPISAREQNWLFLVSTTLNNLLINSPVRDVKHREVKVKVLCYIKFVKKQRKCSAAECWCWMLDLKTNDIYFNKHLKQLNVKKQSKSCISGCFEHWSYALWLWWLWSCLRWRNKTNCCR